MAIFKVRISAVCIYMNKTGRFPTGILHGLYKKHVICSAAPQWSMIRSQDLFHIQILESLPIFAI